MKSAGIHLHQRTTLTLEQGHGVLDPDSSTRHIGATRAYLQDFNATAPTASTALDLYEKMLALHANRVNPGSLWATVKVLKGSTKA
jgi:hypothetical protein